MPGFEIFGDEERKEVNEVLDTGVLFRYGFEGPRKERRKAKEFETLLSDILSRGAKGQVYTHLCSSGTAALVTALSACGIGAGDEVIVPPFTFIATIEAVLQAGAVPVFAEIDETLCLSPESAKNLITEKTRCILPVHMCGAMAKIKEISAICETHNLVLIEDACQAIGGSVDGIPLGTFGKMGCFSFDAVKTITCGEGGGVVSRNKDLYLLADAFSDHGHDHIGTDRGAEGHAILGTNYRISELNAAVGLAQLRKLGRILETQRRNKAFFKNGLGDLSGIRFRKIPDPDGDSATFFTFFLQDEKSAREASQALSRAKVDGCFYWFDNNWHYIRKWDHLKNLRTAGKLPLDLIEGISSNLQKPLPESDAIMARAVSMLIKLSWTEKDMEERLLRMREVLK